MLINTLSDLQVKRLEIGQELNSRKHTGVIVNIIKSKGFTWGTTYSFFIETANGIKKINKTVL